MIDILLIQPESGGNLGAIARTMANFGFSDLVLIDPKCKKDSKVARNRAKHANYILDKAKVKKRSYLKNYDYLIATTAILGSDYNIPRNPITPQQLAEKFSGLDIKEKKIGIMIGRESSGLTNQEISLADFIVTIPSNSNYPTLNISHAVSIILYELSKEQYTTKITEKIKPAGKKEKDELMKLVNKRLNEMNFPTKEKKQTQKLIWKRLLGKSFLTRREIFALFGFFRRLR
ncbi:MAG: TrmJ/YjtD family RNA methyltransferase [Nanoarchaeota archaeon]|nr:TrmJ/YjtD family RNA methyltransferase [Nanoarchaeota archaeon]MBU1705090.1 TrmJ/YjtD family RNA methyltransferase [Nanoarchaeota archaeon]